ncbi:MAG: hypothetical protein H5T69_09190 [Chloroflexi bacterium]|nr:hypothetical protein [Chloroflexota bacterium]
MNKIDSALRRAWRQAPDVDVDVIVHVDDAPKRVAALKEKGLAVRRVFALTQTVAGACKAAAARDIADLPFVSRIEIDRPVRATRS